MKKLGLLGGMTWESTVTYYQQINEHVKNMLGGYHSAEMLMYSVDFAVIEELHRQNDFETATKILADAALALKAAGAEIIIICTNTMHLCADGIKAATGLPVLHIAEVTGKRIKEAGLTKVGLTGSKFTMGLSFYKDILNSMGIEVVTPQPEDAEEINRVIYEELTFGVLKDSSREAYKKSIREMASRGAQGVILGCTEIGLLIKQSDCDIPVFDTTLIHSEEAVKLAIAE